MHIDIQARDFSVTDSLRSHIDWRIRFALSCYSDHIRRVVIRLSDINGPRGGIDKRCHLQVIVAGRPDVVIEDVETELYVAIGRAIDRARRTLRRKMDRQQSLLKQGGKLPIPAI